MTFSYPCPPPDLLQPNHAHMNPVVAIPANSQIHTNPNIRLYSDMCKALPYKQLRDHEFTTFSNHILSVVLKSESKAYLKQTTFCLFGYNYIVSEEFLFGTTFCKTASFLRHVTYWIHLATHRRADVEETLAEGFPVAWFTSLEALISYPISHFMCRKSQRIKTIS